MDFTLNDPVANATNDAWFILPEELRPWYSSEMAYLQNVATLIKRYDATHPNGRSRPVSMYNDRFKVFDGQLETTVGDTGLDWAMMGLYVTPQPFNTRAARIALGADRIAEAASNTSTEPIGVFELQEDFNTSSLNSLRAALGGVSAADAMEQVIRADVYQGLLRGIEKIQLFVGCDCTGMSTFHDQLDAYITVSTDLNGPLGLSNVFLEGEDRNDFQATVLTGPTSVSWSGVLDNNPATKTIDTVTVGDIAYGGDRYLFLTNSSNSPLTIRVDGLPIGIADITDIFANASDLNVVESTGEMFLSMDPFEVIGLQIESVINADANGDGLVGGSDFLAWQRGHGSSGATTLAGGDFNYDGVVNDDDLSVWQDLATGAGAVAASATVPEPSTLCLAGCIAGLFVARRTRR